jgi:hypothetical protein
VRFQVLTAASIKFRFIFWDVLIALMTEAARTSETIILHGSTSQKTNLNFKDNFATVLLWQLNVSVS